MPTPNVGARGEGTITLPDGGEVAVLYTNRALMDAETRIQRSPFAAIQEWVDGNIMIGEVANILLAGMQSARRDARTGGPAHRLEDALDVLDQVGVANVISVVAEAMATVLAFDGSAQEPSPNP